MLWTMPLALPLMVEPVRISSATTTGAERTVASRQFRLDRDSWRRFNSDQSTWGLPMNAAPSAVNFALLFGLSFFLGLAFEDFFAHAATKRPGGIRTFPMLALAGGMLYLFDPVHLLPFTGGLLVLGAWLAIFYSEHIRERDEQGEPNVGLVVLVLNVHAYLLGAVALALPNWVAVGATVAAVLLLTGRERLHELARRVEMKEIITLGQFLILTGLVLPLLPSEPVTTLTSITPRQVWFALLVVAPFPMQVIWPSATGPRQRAACGWRRSVASTLRPPLLSSSPVRRE